MALPINLPTTCPQCCAAGAVMEFSSAIDVVWWLHCTACGNIWNRPKDRANVESVATASDGPPKRASAHQPKPGRPPSGVRFGDRVRDYPQVSVRLPAETRTLLNAMSAISGKPQWRVVIDALESFYEAQPEPARAHIRDRCHPGQLAKTRSTPADRRRQAKTKPGQGHSDRGDG